MYAHAQEAEGITSFEKFSPYHTYGPFSFSQLPLPFHFNTSM